MIIFVKVRNDEGQIYQSYDIIWKLIDWNFKSCELDEVEPMSNEIYIFVTDNGNVKACCERPHSAKYIHWNIEIPIDGSNGCRDHFDETWFSCQYYFNLSKGKKKFIVLGGDKRLVSEPQAKEWDFCHLAYVYGKRAEQVAQLEAQGFTMAPVGFDDIRNKSIAKSRWGLCLHQHNVPTLSPQRMTLFACRKLPIVIEECDPYPYKVIKLQDFRPLEYKELADENFRLFTEKYNFKKEVEEICKS